jgi:hypothetical protein
LFEIGLHHVRARELDASFVARDLVAFERPFGQAQLEFRVRAPEFDERVVASGVVAFDGSLGELPREFRIGAGEFDDRASARGSVAPGVRDDDDDQDARDGGADGTYQRGD